MSINVELLKAICKTPGAPGYESRIRKQVASEIEGLVNEITIDNMGSIIATRKSKNPDAKKVMITAHMDEISFIVTHIDDNGFIRFHTLGGFDPKTLTAQRVLVHGKKDVIGVMGTKPIHVMSPEERNKMPKIKDYFIDLGMTKEAVMEVVSVGDTITRERELIEMGDCVNSKSLDNRVSVFILIEALKELKDKELPVDVVAAFTVQEEVGIRGANVASHQVNPDFGINLDVTVAFDTPGAPGHEKITELGKGAAIKIMDGSTICDYRMVDYLKEIANRHSIDWQPEILTAGGTDTAGLQRMGKNGSIAGGISIPTRNLHQVIEMAHKEDIDRCIKLLARSVEALNEYEWGHR
jgi:tetrahedral aminopeptidase